MASKTAYNIVNVIGCFTAGACCVLTIANGFGDKKTLIAFGICLIFAIISTAIKPSDD